MAKHISNQRILRFQTWSLPTRSRNELIIDDFVKVRPARSFMPQDNVQNVPDPVRIWPSARNCSTEEVGKVQKIREHENESVRQKINWVAHQVSALAQQQQTPDSSESNIPGVIRMKFDEKIEKLVKSQRDISTIVEQLFTLRCATNTLLKAPAALNRTAQEEVATTGNVSEEVPDKITEAIHCSTEIISGQVYVRTGNESCNSR